MTRADLLGAAYGGGLALGLATVGLAWPALVLPTLALAALMADGIARPASSLLVPTLSRVRGARDRVALTFDDGPDPDTTPQVAAALAQAGARATFFCIGRKLAQQRELARRLLDDGHELANHSYHHSRLTNFRGARYQRREIERTEQLLAELGARRARPLYRPPVGLRNPPLARVAHQLELVVVNWSVRSLDTRRRSPARIAARVLDRVTGGDIVLLHDGSDRDGAAPRTATAEALPILLDGLATRGLRSVTVSDLLDEAR